MGSVGDSTSDYDVLIIGGGLSGIYSLYRMRELGLKARVLEAAPGEGGTWWWNRYPGCRFDSESYTYHFTFSKEILDEWSWSEHFAPAPETLRYAQFICDKFDLRKDMQFDTRIKMAYWQTDSYTWLLTDAQGKTYSSRFLITAMGILNDPTLPNIPGVESYQGEAYHTSRWPKEWSVDGKRVGIIGTGATAIQIIPEIAKLPLAQLTVFQRTANWSAPLRNDKIDSKEMEEIRSQYDEIHKACQDSSAGFQYSWDTRKTFDVPKEEREAFWERLYQQRGFSKWVGAFQDLLFDRQANDAYSEFHAKKIRARLDDPVIAEKLIPKNHGFGTRRLPLESNYFEVYNKPNVRLVDYTVDSQIEKITEKGVVLTTGEAIDLDVLIYATGFDAVTGALLRGIDLRGIDGNTLTEAWEDGVKTYLGLFVKNFPNMTMIMGPHQAYGNIPRSIEFAVDSAARFIKYCMDNDVVYAEATEQSMTEWTDHIFEKSAGNLSNDVDGWLTGVNKNVKGKTKRFPVRYSGPAPLYRKIVNEESDKGWEKLYKMMESSKA